jgi:hypothetical protein
MECIGALSPPIFPKGITVADCDVAFQWMMQFEDPTMACAQTPDAAPAGNPGPCNAISGFNSCVWPADFTNIAALPQASRAPAAQAFYQAHFWNKWYAQVTSDDVAKRVFDFAVNGGSGTAVKTLQNAINSLGGSLTVDGGWGPLPWRRPMLPTQALWFRHSRLRAWPTIRILWPTIPRMLNT